MARISDCKLAQKKARKLMRSRCVKCKRKIGMTAYEGYRTTSNGTLCVNCMEERT